MLISLGLLGKLLYIFLGNLIASVIAHGFAAIIVGIVFSNGGNNLDLAMFLARGFQWLLEGYMNNPLFLVLFVLGGIAMGAAVALFSMISAPLAPLMIGLIVFKGSSAPLISMPYVFLFLSIAPLVSLPTAIMRSPNKILIASMLASSPFYFIGGVILLLNIIAFFIEGDHGVPVGVIIGDKPLQTITITR